MNYDNLIDAISDIDIKFLDEHFSMDEKLKKEKYKKEQKMLIQNRVSISAAAICASLLLCLFVNMLVHLDKYHKDNPNGDITLPDSSDGNFGSSDPSQSAEKYGLNAPYIKGSERILVNEVYVTENLYGRSGRFLVFSGYVETERTLIYAGLENGMLYLSLLNNNEGITEISYEKELSHSFSNAELNDLYFPNRSVTGDFSLVFSIDEVNYSLLKTGQAASGKDTVMSLNFGTSFSFSLKDVKIEK